MAVHKLTSKIYQSFDNYELILAVCFDLPKAFDAVNYFIILGKLTHFWITGVTNDRLRSYLSDSHR